MYSSFLLLTLLTSLATSIPIQSNPPTNNVARESPLKRVATISARQPQLQPAGATSNKDLEPQAESRTYWHPGPGHHPELQGKVPTVVPTVETESKVVVAGGQEGASADSSGGKGVANTGGETTDASGGKGTANTDGQGNLFANIAAHRYPHR